MLQNPIRASIEGRLLYQYRRALDIDAPSWNVHTYARLTCITVRASWGRFRRIGLPAHVVLPLSGLGRVHWRSNVFVWTSIHPEPGQFSDLHSIFNIFAGVFRVEDITILLSMAPSLPLAHARWLEMAGS